MQESKLRRLFNIKVNHVSLVDRAANKHSFLLVKRDDSKGEGKMDEIKSYLKDVLGKIEDALNTSNDRLEKLESQEGIFKFEVGKAGAKFSKDTVSKLKSLRDTLNLLIGEEPAEKDDNTVDAAKAIIDGFDAACKKSGEKTDKNADIAGKISKAIAEALENKEE